MAIIGKTILLVEDNPKVMKNNVRLLSERGAKIEVAETLAQARALIVEKSLDAVVLDIMMPDGSGLDFLREIREGNSSLPVLMLTAKNEINDVIKGFDIGTDDYLVKPYDLNVFAVRVDALLRRACVVNKNIAIGLLRFDLMSHQAFYDGIDLLLTQKEFSLLLLLAENENKILTADYLFVKAYVPEYRYLSNIE